MGRDGSLPRGTKHQYMYIYIEEPQKNVISPKTQPPTLSSYHRYTAIPRRWCPTERGPECVPGFRVHEAYVRHARDARRRITLGKNVVWPAPLIGRTKRSRTRPIPADLARTESCLILGDNCFCYPRGRQYGSHTHSRHVHEATRH